MRATLASASEQYAAILRRADEAAATLEQCNKEMETVHARFRQARRTLGITDPWRPLQLPTVPSEYRSI